MRQAANPLRIQIMNIWTTIKYFNRRILALEAHAGIPTPPPKLTPPAKGGGA